MIPNTAKQSSLSREELYQRVWSTPIRKLAPCFGLSDVGLTKLCERYKIPTPARGYWAKKQHGKAARQTPLPTEADPALQVIRLVYDPEPKPRETPTAPMYPVKTPELVTLVERERDPKFRITVADSLRNLHPVVARMRDAFGGGVTPDRYNLVRVHCDGEAVDLAVGPQSVSRALRLFNALFLSLEKRGWPVAPRPRSGRYAYDSDRVRCSLLGEEFGFTLREKMRMVRVPPEERTGRFAYREVRYESKGVFELSVSGGHFCAVGTWRDGKKVRVEDQLNDVVVGLIVAVERNRERREAQTREEERRQIAEEARRERERLEQLERDRISRFESLADRWVKTARLRAFLDAVKAEAVRRQVTTDADPGFARWLEWAERHVQSIDPLGATHPLSVY